VTCAICIEAGTVCFHLSVNLCFLSRSTQKVTNDVSMHGAFLFVCTVQLMFMIVFISPHVVASQQKYYAICNTNQWNMINNMNLTKLK